MRDRQRGAEREVAERPASSGPLVSRVVCMRRRLPRSGLRIALAWAVRTIRTDRRPSQAAAGGPRGWIGPGPAVTLRVGGGGPPEAGQTGRTRPTGQSCFHVRALGHRASHPARGRRQSRPVRRARRRGGIAPPLRGASRHDPRPHRGVLRCRGCDHVRPCGARGALALSGDRAAPLAAGHRLCNRPCPGSGPGRHRAEVADVSAGHGPPGGFAGRVRHRRSVHARCGDQFCRHPRSRCRISRS